jgi:tetratricopeptide (TPR) repeat protein
LDDVNKKVLEGLREVIAKRDFVEALDLIAKECKSWSSHASNLNKTHMAEVHHLEGTVYDSLGQYEQAVEAHNKANELITMEKRDAGSALLKIRSLTALVS